MHNNTQKRDEWEFKYTAKKLADAAALKVKSHSAKKEWWEKQFADVLKKVPEGIEVHDSLASAYSNTKGQYGAEVVVDSTLQRDLGEAQGKIREHEGLVREYEGWVQVLEANQEAQLSLTHDDWLYFFGK